MQMLVKTTHIMRILFVTLLFSFATASAQPGASTPRASELNLHVPSPDWRDQIIYFLMIDRFNDGDPGNNDQGANEFDPGDSRKFSGGDLEGIIEKVGYIKDLGATAVWITPPVANQWWDPRIAYGGYHGYWAENFKKIDAHFGSLETYQRLSHTLHENGMYLIQDIVINHTGNFFEYLGEFDSSDPARNFHLKEGPAPSQHPFNMNDVRDERHRRAAIYHWTPAITDYGDPAQKQRHQLAGLDDINTENPEVRRVLRDSFGHWVREAGVDGFRIDTIIYVEKDFWQDFFYSGETGAPGINLLADSTGREDFLSFGEAFISADPMDNTTEREIATYVGTKGAPALSSMLNFPLFFTINKVFAQGLPTRYLAYRLNTMMDPEIYANPFVLTNFLDNHDVQRLVRASTPVALEQALLFLMTIPGIPVIYQGTEQLFEEDRASMFASGWGADGVDHFEQDSRMFLFVKNLCRIRRENRLFSRGALTVLADSPDGAGVLAYQRQLGDQRALVLFNTADQAMLLENMTAGVAAGTRLQQLAGLGLSGDLIAGTGGRITEELPARAAGVYLIRGEIAQPVNNDLELTVAADLAGNTFTRDFVVTGWTSDSRASQQLVIDGKLEQAIALFPNSAGDWEVAVPIERFPFGWSSHSLTAYAAGRKVASETRRFMTDLAVQQGRRTSVDDAAHDDHGPAGDYLKPRHPGFTGQMDIRRTEVISLGGNLRIELTVGEISDPWLPPNGFDHAAFHIFIDLPDKTGASVLPKLHAGAPEAFAWDYFSYIGGWNNMLFSSDGAGADEFGAVITPVPKIEVNKEEKKITLEFLPASLGNPVTLAGARIYITTWDNTGANGLHRPIGPAAGAFTFGGSDDPQAPLILDDTVVITLE